jgi:hypothetical protein
MKTMVERVGDLARTVNLNLFSSEDLALQLAQQIDQMLAEALAEARAASLSDVQAATLVSPGSHKEG